jgi:hypothetical protein
VIITTVDHAAIAPSMPDRAFGATVSLFVHGP